MIKSELDVRESLDEATAQRLSELRKNLGLGSGDFADAIGVDRSSYSKIEKGVKPLLPKVALKICERYGVDMNYLYLGRSQGDQFEKLRRYPEFEARLGETSKFSEQERRLLALFERLKPSERDFALRTIRGLLEFK